MSDMNCRTCHHRFGHYSAHFVCAVHLDYRLLVAPFECADFKMLELVPSASFHVVESTARPERSEDGRNGSTTFNPIYRFNQAKTSLKSFRFGFFFARFKRVVFFICRVVARQMSPVNKTFGGQ